MNNYSDLYVAVENNGLDFIKAIIFIKEPLVYDIENGKLLVFRGCYGLKNKGSYISKAVRKLCDETCYAYKVVIFHGENSVEEFGNECGLSLFSELYADKTVNTPKKLNNTDVFDLMTISEPIKVNLTVEDINDILSAATSLGIKHWCKEVIAYGERRQGNRNAQRLLAGGSISFCREYKGSYIYHILTLERLIKGIKRYLQDDCEIVDEGGYVEYLKITPKIGDHIVQYALFNKILYWRN